MRVEQFLNTMRELRFCAPDIRPRRHAPNISVASESKQLAGRRISVKRGDEPCVGEHLLGYAGPPGVTLTDGGIDVAGRRQLHQCCEERQ
jgi:hypothetical protein